MAARKFHKKTERNPAKELAVFFIIIIAMVIASICIVRYKINNEKPFITTNNKQLGYLDFKMEFDSDKPYKTGQPIEMRMFIKNISDKQIEITFPYSVEVDFLVFKEEDWFFFKIPSLIWSYAIAQKSFHSPHKINIKPGETQKFTAYWPQTKQDGSKAPAGNYNIIGKIMTSDFNISLSLRKKQTQ